MFLLPEIALSLVLLVVIYHLAPKLSGRYSQADIQNSVLLLYSCGLFAFLAPVFLLLLGIYTALICVVFKVFNFRKSVRAARYLPALALGLIVFCVSMLAAVKYYNPVREFLGNASPVFAAMPALTIVLGFSASFLTFQVITLIIAGWRGELGSQTRVLHMALFVGFFPTLAAGPIVRADQLLPQLAQGRSMIAPRYAVARILLGVWQMLVCAQWLAEVWVNPIYASPQSHHGVEVLAAAIAYSLQIYLDFSGLSNIVMGMGWLLGLRLPRNFRSPYVALNIRDFWRRWHISLSTWIRDYLYKPLGGSRKGFVRAQLAVAASMGLSGIWHGAALTFVVWAGLHILAVIVLNTRDALNLRWRLPRGLSWGLTFMWVSAAWVFFRADNLDHAAAIFSALGNTQSLIQYNVLGFTGLVGVFFAMQYFGPRCAQLAMRQIQKMSHWVFAAWVTLSLYLAIELGPSGVPNFIYAGF